MSRRMQSAVTAASVLLISGMTAASAADLYTKAPLAKQPVELTLPAVDGINGKVELLGGTLTNKSLAGVRGALSIPLGHQFGVQIDGVAGGYDGRAFGGLSGHAFWRDPAQGLAGLYASHTRWDYAGGLYVSQFGAEAALYRGRWTIEGIAGIEGGNQQTIVVGPWIQTYNIQTRFFDMVDVAYYLNDDFRVSVGHRYLGGNHAAAFGAEYALKMGMFGPGTAAALFADARLGENGYNGIWGGLRVYFGKNDKTLIRRHREDDPPIRLPEVNSTLSNNAGNSSVPVPAPCVMPAGAPRAQDIVYCTDF